MRHLRVCIGEILNKILDMSTSDVDYYLIDTYEDRTLGFVCFCNEQTARKIERELETKYGILITERFHYKSQYKRAPLMIVLHCRIVEEADERGF